MNKIKIEIAPGLFVYKDLDATHYDNVNVGHAPDKRIEKEVTGCRVDEILTIENNNNDTATP